MTEAFCSYRTDRDDLLVAYVYNDIEPDERDRFAAHLATCVRCRTDVSEITGVRAALATWSPPSFAAVPNPPHRESRIPKSGWRTMPAWAQAAAAVLLLGLGAGLANLDVRYDQRGVTVRTGWLNTVAEPPSQGRGEPRSAPAPPAIGAGDSSPAGSAPWRTDLAALERQLRTECHPPPAGRAAPSEVELLRRVRALVEESERRRQRELALRVADVMRDLDTQRRADLVKIDRSLGLIQNNAGVEVLKQRELLNYLVRASQNK